MSVLGLPLYLRIIAYGIFLFVCWLMALRQNKLLLVKCMDACTQSARHFRFMKPAQMRLLDSACQESALLCMMGHWQHACLTWESKWLASCRVPGWPAAAGGAASVPRSLRGFKAASMGVPDCPARYCPAASCGSFSLLCSAASCRACLPAWRFLDPVRAHASAFDHAPAHALSMQHGQRTCKQLCKAMLHTLCQCLAEGWLSARPAC